MKISNRFFEFIFAMIVIVAGLLTFASCQEDHEDTVMARQQKEIVYDGYIHESSLVHHWDSTRRVSITDVMDALLSVWRSENGAKSDLLYSNTVNPEFNASSLLRKTEYNISEDQLNPRVIATWLARANGDNNELDTLYVDFADGQRDSIPMDISNISVEIGGNSFNHGTLTVIDAKFDKLTNTPISATRGITRAQYVAASYNREYKSLITLQEKNVNMAAPKTFVVPVYAYATVHLLKDDEIVKIEAENKKREILTDSTERCSFEKVITYSSGDEIRETVDIILKREFKGIDTYEKAVSNFDYTFNTANGISRGTDTPVREEDKWTVNGRTDRYSATITNGVNADRITTDYSLYHERAVYVDGDFTVDFGYESVRVDEIETTITKQQATEAGKDKAIENNKIKTVYIGHVQNLEESVILVKTSKLVSGYEIANPLLKVFNDSVVATLDFVTNYSDGSKETEHERLSAPRSLICTTDWQATQIQATQVTDDNIGVTLVSSNEKKEGAWKFTEQTRRLDNYAHLSDESTKHNSWTAVVPNSISYTREGKTHDFGVLAFEATHVGATLTATGKSDGGDIYAYTDEITVRYENNSQNITAPGKILVNGSKIKGYEIRDKKLVVTNDDVTASLTFVTVFMNGTEDKEAFSKTLPRSLKVNTNWSAVETATTDQTTSQPNVVKTGSQAKTDEEWAWNEETRSITTTAKLASSTQNNNWTSIDPNNIVFTKNGQSVDFGTINFSAVYVNATVTQQSKTGLVETYSYTNTINVSFGDNIQTTSAPGTVTIEREKVVTDHEIRDAKMVISDTEVTCSLTYVTIWNDGTETTEPVTKSFPRSLSPYTNWSSEENNGNEQTGAATVVDLFSKSVTDGNWSYTREERDIVTKVTLSASTKENGWTSVEPNSIVYTRDGKSHAFGKIDFEAKEDGHSAVLGNSSATLDVYNYTDKLTVTYGDNTISSTAPGKINVKKEIVPISYEITDQKLDVQQTGVTASLNFITKFSDGSQTSEKIQKFFERRFAVITNWSAVETNNTQSTSATTVKLDKSENKTDGDWSYVSETRSISTTATLAGSTQSNGWTSVDPNSIVFTKNGKTYAFGSISFAAAETGANVEQTSDAQDKTVYSYKDNISVTFGTNTFASFAPGTITVNKKYITSEGWDESSAEKKFTDDNLYCRVDYVIHYSDGEEVRTKFEHNFARSLVCTSNWSSVETSASQTTTGATQTKVETRKSDGNWEWKGVTSTIVSGVNLAGSVQSNSWEAVEADAVFVTYRGSSFGFGNDTYNISNSKGAVANGVENGDYTDYAYTDVLSYKYGTANVKNSTAKGLIRVEIEEDPFFPKEWGKLLAAYQTVAPNNVTRDGYVYTWSLHFEKGTMPVVIQKGSTSPEWHFESFTNETDSRINGGYYKRALGKWVNSIASDEKDWMLWLDSNNANLGNVTYSLATSWKWDENHTVSSHPSVTTKRFELKVENGTLYAKDTYLNKTMTDSHVNKNGGWK